VLAVLAKIKQNKQHDEGTSQAWPQEEQDEEEGKVVIIMIASSPHKK